MTASDASYDCARCGTAFSQTAHHTEIVRRDFVEMPRPTRIERLCVDCWEAYVSDFLGRDFEELVATYEAE